MTEPELDQDLDLFGPTVLEVRDLTVRYGKARVLDGLDLSVAEGEVVALLGRNGAGKSSLVRCLLGQQKPQQGRVRLFGEDVWRHRARLMTRVGVVPEEPDAPPTMTAAQLERFCSRLYPTWDGDSCRQRLARYEVPTDTAFRSLSKGQKAQVMLALALAPRPELLILDDPTLGLDAVARRGVFEEVIGELADRGITVLLTSHDLAGVESIASRVALLRDGALWLDQDLEDLKQDVRWIEVTLAPDVELPAADDPAAVRSLVSDELWTETLPIQHRLRGRRLEVLTGHYRDYMKTAFETSFGTGRVQIVPASLEEIVVAYGDLKPGSVRDADRSEDA